MYAVSRSGGKTTLSYRARDFGTVKEAESYIRGGCPEGFVGTVATIDRGERKIKPRLQSVKSAVARRTLMPGQLVYLDDLETKT